MKKWATLTDDLKFCEITFDGEWYRVKVSDEMGQEMMVNESISLPGAKKQIKRFVGGDQKIKWQEIESDKIEVGNKLHLPTGYLSVSQVQKYLKCPQQYEFRYVSKLPETKNGSLILGSAFHKGMQTASITKALQGEIMSTDDVLDVYSQAFDYSKENDEIEWGDDDPGLVKDNGTKMMAKYYEEYGSQIVPFVDAEGLPFVERKHTFEIVPGLKVFGIMDVITDDGFIRDYKTSSKSPSQNIIDEKIQLPVYSMMYRDLFGQKESGVGFDYIVNLKKEKKAMRLETEGPIDDNRIERTKQTFVGVAKSISAGIFYPNEESNSCGYCSFKKICKKINS
jgi:CRISPR/Cas system-associated exonuclease Cas4 (RecB family)